MIKVIVVSDTRINGKPVSRDTEIEFDDAITTDADTLGHLNAAGRIVVQGTEGHKQYVADRQAEDKAKAEKAKAAKAAKAE